MLRKYIFGANIPDNNYQVKESGTFGNFDLDIDLDLEGYAGVGFMFSNSNPFLMERIKRAQTSH